MKGVLSTIKDEEGYYFVDRNGAVFEVLPPSPSSLVLLLPPFLPPLPSSLFPPSSCPPFMSLFKGVLSTIKDEEGYYFVDRNGAVFEVPLLPRPPPSSSSLPSLFPPRSPPPSFSFLPPHTCSFFPPYSCPPSVLSRF
jgi:hypothetical protein